MWRQFLASMCVVASLLFSGCGPVLLPPGNGCDRPTIYAFSATWCSGCNADKPRLAQLEQEGFKVVRVDLDKRPDLQQKYHIEAVPLYFVVCGDRVVLRTNELSQVIKTVH